MFECEWVLEGIEVLGIKNGGKWWRVNCRVRIDGMFWERGCMRKLFRE